MYGRIRKRNSILRVCENRVCGPCEGLHSQTHYTPCLPPLFVFFDLKMQGAQARPHASKNDAFETPHRSVHTPSANTGVQMVGLWYAVPTLVIIGKGFPLSPHGEAECQVSMHTHNTNRKKPFFIRGGGCQCVLHCNVFLLCFYGLWIFWAGRNARQKFMKSHE